MQAFCQQLFGEADTDNGGSVSFPEFVKYATDASRGKMFETLCAEIKSPKKGPATGGGAAANMPRMLLDTDEDLLKLARMHFHKADTDGKGTLDGNELVAVVRELAQANKTPLNLSALETEVRRCLNQFGNGQVVDKTGFCKYVGSLGDFFRNVLFPLLSIVTI